MTTEPKPSLTRRLTVLLYGVFSYAIFLGIFLYAFGFLMDIGVPKSLDDPRSGSFLLALIINAFLLGLFAIQHSVMARPWFKRWWTRFVPEPAERSTYVLFTNIALALIFAFWQPMGGIVWQITSPTGKAIAYTIGGLGWALVLAATFLINHFDLFGLRQVWLYFRNTPYTKLEFKTPAFYKDRTSPALRGLDTRVLGDTDDDDCSLGLRPAVHRLHAGCDSI